MDIRFVCSNYFRAAEDMNCNASQFFLKAFRSHRDDETIKWSMPVLINANNYAMGRPPIRKGETFIEVTYLLDGEECEFHALPCVDEFCLKNNLYPDFLMIRSN